MKSRYEKFFASSVTLIVVVSLFAGCGSNRVRARKEERDKLAQSSKIYCDFVNGEIYPDIEVATNLEMAKHCDSEKSFTLTSYHSPSDNIGLVFCCRTTDTAFAQKDNRSSLKTSPKPATAVSSPGAVAKPNAPNAAAKDPSPELNEFEGN